MRIFPSSIIFRTGKVLPWNYAFLALEYAGRAGYPCPMSPGTRIRLARKQQGLTQDALSRLIGLETQSALSRYESGEREPTLDTIKKIARALDVTPSWILFGTVLDGAPDRPSDALRVEEDARYQPPPVASDDYISIARFDAAFSAGGGAVLDPHTQPLGFQLFERAWLQTVTRASPDDLAVVRVRGDSMDPTLSDGDWVLMDRTARTLSQEGVYAIQVGDSAWIKRLSLNFAARKIRILSDNTAYPPQEVDEADIYIVGRIIAIVARRL